MATHSSNLAWNIPWVEEPGRLQSIGLQRVRHNRATSLALFTLFCGTSCKFCLFDLHVHFFHRVELLGIKLFITLSYFSCLW